jgi:hypothetical protein
MTATTEIETGVETANDRIKTTDWEVEAYADDGEYATCWMLRRVSETEIEQATIRCEAGLRDQVRPIDVFEVDADTTVTEFAREVAQADPELAIELAEDYWG